MRAVGFFCEDIRAEIAGTESIIGVFPDNMVVAELPAAVPKFAVQIRIQLDIDEPAKTIKAFLKTPWAEFPIGEASAELIEKAQTASKSFKLPYAGIVLRAVFATFPVQDFGQIIASVVVDGVETACAAMNIRRPDVATSSTAPPPQP